MSPKNTTSFQRLRQSVLFRNTFSLYGAHVAGLLLPLIAVPFLARVLRPDGWGIVLFAQSFAAWLALVLEYGFYLSASREIARERADLRVVSRIVRDVQSAKLMLLLAVTLITLIAYLTVPLVRAHPQHLFWAWLLAAAQGYSPYWYYQGVERLGLIALTEATSKAVATLLLFLLISSPTDGPLVLALYAIPALFWSLFANAGIYRSAGFERLDLRAGLRMLATTGNFFVFRAAHGSYVAANSFILGALSVPQAVAFFGGAERIIRGAINLIHPATQAIYPRISNLVGRDQDRAARLMVLTLIILGAGGVMMGLAAGVAAPFLVSVLLGPGYQAAVPVLRVLSLLPPLVAVGTVLGLQWALPSGHERPYFRLVVAGAVLNVVLAVGLAPRFGAMGMASAVVGAELFVTTGLVILAAVKGRDVWGWMAVTQFRGSGAPAPHPGSGMGEASDRSTAVAMGAATSRRTRA